MYDADKARTLVNRFFPTHPSSDIPAYEAVHTRVAEILTSARATENPDVSSTESHAVIWALARGKTWEPIVSQKHAFKSANTS